MAVALQTIGLGTQAVDTTSITITAPADIADGDLLLALISVDSGALVAGTGFDVPATGGAAQDGARGTVLTKIASSESGDYNFTWTGNQKASGAILRIDGQSDVNFLDEFGIAVTTPGAYPTAVPAFVRHPGSLYVGAVFTDGNETSTVDSPLTERVDQDSGGASGTCHLYVATGSPPASAVGHYYPYFTSNPGFPFYRMSGTQYRTLVGLMILPAREPGVNFGVVHPGMSGGMNG